MFASEAMKLLLGKQTSGEYGSGASSLETSKDSNFDDALSQGSGDSQSLPPQSEWTTYFNQLMLEMDDKEPQHENFAA